METTESLVIVGAGVAASELAWQVRQGGWTGSIHLIGDEPALPYNRPPLSKAWLDGSGELASLWIRPQAAYEKANVDCITGAAVVAFDRGRRQVQLSDGRDLHYTRLALCTGGRSRPWEPEGMPVGRAVLNLHSLRTLADAERLRPVLRPGMRLAVVGAGYVGLEVAASARKLGADVVVIEQQSRVLARSAGDAISDFIAGLHRGHGVDLRVGSGVLGVEVVERSQGPVIAALRLDDGTRLECDQVLYGIGMLPNAELAVAAGLAVEGGIVVDDLSRTSDPDIVAAGDCTVQEVAAGRWMRLESVPNALEQARAAASWLVGKPKPNRSVPWFWSDQYEAKMRMVGLSVGHDRIVLRGGVDGDGFLVFYLRDGVPIATESVNRPTDFLFAKRLVAAGAPVDPAQLEDVAAPLKDLLHGPKD